jgi:hypothetical protein
MYQKPLRCKADISQASLRLNSGASHVVVLSLLGVGQGLPVRIIMGTEILGI